MEVTDAAGRVSSACDDIVLDLTGAPGTVAIARASGNFSTDADAALSTTFRSADPTIASVAFAQAPLDCASVAAASFVALAVNTDLVRDVNVAGGEGTRAVTGCFKSQSGLLTSTTDTVFVDPIDPPLAQPLAPGPVSSSGNGTLVSTRTPTFQWGAVNGASSFTVLVRRVSDGVNVLTQAGLTGLSFAPAAGQALPEVPLEWIVVAVKPSGRSSAVSFVGAARLTPDATLPTAPSALTVAVHAPGRALVTTPAPCTATKPCVNDPFPTLSFTPGTDAGTGVSQIVELTLNGDFTSPLLTLTRVNGAAFDIPNGLEDGSYRWRVRAVDGAGNQTISATSDFLVDRTPPLPPTIVPPPDPVSQTVTSPLVINWSNELSSGALTYKFDITTDVLGFGAPLTPPSTVTAATSVDVTGRLVNGAGVRHIVRVASIDALGNQSAFTTATFIHDSAAPCATSSSVAIVGSDPAGDFTDSSVVTVGVTCVGPAGDNPSTMKVACDGVLDNEPKIGFAPTTTCVLNPGQGLRTVVVKIFDAAGNATGNLTDTVTVDTSSPTTPILATADTVTRLVTFPIAIASGSIDANFDHHEFLDGVNNAQFTTFYGSSFNVVFNNTAAQPNQLYNVRVRGVDKAGNASAEAIVKITFDGQAPTTPAILGNDVVHFVNADTFTFTLAVGSDDVSFASYQTAQCAGTGCTVSAGSFTDNPGNGTFTFTLPQDQATTFAVRGRDKAGNVSGVSTIDVVEDSHNPRPVALQRLPEKSLAGAPFASAKVLGPYVDVFFARTETNITPPGIDPNFDHFEVRAETAAFQGFVPMCDVPTPSCPVPFITDGGQTVDQSKLLIKLNNTIVGFRVPVVKNQSNTITLRSVDKAGNVSIETTTSTTEIGVQTVTTDGHASFAPFIFGDKIAFIDAIAGNVLRVKELGNDQLWGTADDGNTAIDSGVNTEGAQFNFQSTRAIAMGPNLVFWDKVVGGVNRVQMMASGNDGSFAGAADNSAIQNASSDGGGVVVDESKAQGEPSFWRDRLAWRQSTAATETDVMVRQAGANGIFGDGDDVFAKIGAPLSHRLFPVVSGDNLAFLLCADKNPASCPGAVPLQLVVVNSGVDRVFGTGDDVTTTLTQATEITAMRPELYTPGTTGRAACRNVVAYGGIGGHRGIQVIATEPDGTFTANDTPVGISQFDGFSGALRSFSLYDTIATSNDQNSGPSTEIDFAGPDGCFTRSADNLAFDGGVAGDVGAVGWNSLVVEVQQPQLHLAYVEYGAERAVWPRPEGTPDFALNLESDRQGFATGSGAYDFTTRTMRTPTLGTGAFNKDVLFERYWAYAADGSGASPTLEDLFVRDRGVDEIMGSADDVERRVTTAHRMFENRDQRAPFGRTFDVDENAVAFAAQRSADTQIIPVVRSAGVDGVLGTGDDCEIETNAAPDPNGYTQVHLARGRIGFQACADPGCFLTFGPVFVREVATGSDPCTGAALPVTTVSAGATLPHLDGERVAFIDASRPAIVDAGLDHRFASQSDNVLTRLFVPNGNNIAQALAISGDRVVWIDQRTGVDRVVVGDLGDLSERVLTRSAEADSTVTIDGDVLTYGSHVPGSFATDSAALYYFGVQPDLPNDFVNNGPTRLRCPTDDIYEENDSQVTATPINSGAAVNAIVCKNDPDRYAVNAGAGCSVHAHAHFVNADGDVDMDVLQPDNTVLTSSAGVQNDERIDVATGGVAGLWQVQVRGFNGAENTYDLTVNVTCP